MSGKTRPLFWVGSSRKDLKKFPWDVRYVMGYALLLAQEGDKHPDAKPLTGLRGVIEIVDDYDGDTFRAMYTVKLKKGVYVLHAFQKKSKKGIKTPKQDIDLIKDRLAWAKEKDNEK